MFPNLLALKLEYAMSVYQKFRDCKTAGPFLCPCTIFARAWSSHAHRAWQISLFTLAPDVSFQRGLRKNPPLNRPSKYKAPGGLYLENCPQIQSKTKQKR